MNPSRAAGKRKNVREPIGIDVREKDGVGVRRMGCELMLIIADYSARILR
jgi:hypothetical protein